MTRIRWFAIVIHAISAVIGLVVWIGISRDCSGGLNLLVLLGTLVAGLPVSILQLGSASGAASCGDMILAPFWISSLVLLVIAVTVALKCASPKATWALVGSVVLPIFGCVLTVVGVVQG